MDLYDINRWALILAPSEALLRWAVSENPSLAEEIDVEDPSDLDTVYLLPEFGEAEEAEEWVEDNFETLLEGLLEEYISDDSLWPDRLEFQHFEKYADYSISSMVIDTMDASYDEN